MPYLCVYQLFTSGFRAELFVRSLKSSIWKCSAFNLDLRTIHILKKLIICNRVALSAVHQPGDTAFRGIEYGDKI